jgi:aerobic carbon-monoxide dehydrogenase small subunit
MTSTQSGSSPQGEEVSSSADKQTEGAQLLSIELAVNGESRSGNAEPRTLLVSFIRDELRLTGTHVGCDTGHCGACTVVLDGKAVKSCMVLAVQARGCELLTVEGLAKGDELHPIQEAFSRNHGLQCGFCTPGLLLSTLFLLERNQDPTDEEIRRAIEGNLCRCTGYVDVVKSVGAAAQAMRQHKALERGEE